MGIGVLGIYGLVPFTCSTFQVCTFKDLQIKHSARYANHEVIGNDPVNEYIGPSHKTVSFKIQLRQQFNSAPTIYIPLLDKMLESGKSWPLCLGPDYMGKYILNSFDEDRLFFNGLGVPIVTDVTLQLTEDQSFSLTKAVTSVAKKIFN